MQRLCGAVAVVADGEGTDARLGGVKQSVGDGGGDTDNGGFAGADGWQVCAIDEDGFDLWNVFETRDVVLGELRVEDFAALESHLLGQRAAETLDDAAFDLGLEISGILNGSAFEGFSHFSDLEGAGA